LAKGWSWRLAEQLPRCLCLVGSKILVVFLGVNVRKDLHILLLFIGLYDFFLLSFRMPASSSVA